jgi:RloB-like protein
MAKRIPPSLRRRHPRLRPRLRLLILCEGRVTEPMYFRDFRIDTRNQLIEIEVVPACGVPKTLVEYAVERKKDAERRAKSERDIFLRYDEVWCVFDVDEHPNLPEAKQQARDNGLQVAVSNPCFELWLLLHFQDQFAEHDRHHIQGLCANHIPGYEKEVPYRLIKDRYPDAVRRAVALDAMQRRRDAPGGNPSTGVYHLTESILRAASFDRK